MLTHIIKAKIKINEHHQNDDQAACKFCRQRALKYCSTCEEYFCLTCDDLAHGSDQDINDERANIQNQLGKQHVRMSVQDAKKHRFGKCKDHQNRKNEYYDPKQNKAFCTTCAIELAQGKKAG